MMFDRDSPVAMVLTALAPLGWLGLFMLRFFAERKKQKVEDKEIDTVKEVGRKKFRDPSEFLREQD